MWSSLRRHGLSFTRNAINSFFFGAIVTLLVALSVMTYEEYSESIDFSMGAQSGVGTAKALFDHAAEESHFLKIEIDDALASTQISGYFFGWNRSYTELAIDLLTNFRQCFVIRERIFEESFSLREALWRSASRMFGTNWAGATKILVEPNRWSGCMFYAEDSARWVCDCDS